jgi:phosphatidylinositol glycan class B
MTGRVIIPTLTFVHRNIVENVSSFYGDTNPIYHLTQSLPLMLFPIWYWWGKGFVSCLLPSTNLPVNLATLDRPDGLCILARAITFSITVLSLSPHSEWRFIHPFLPALLLFALAPIFDNYRAAISGCSQFTTSIRQYVRFGKLPFYLCLFAPILPYLYLNVFHGRAQVLVMDTLREWPGGVVSGVIALMPCHSTPWMSHLHKDIPAWFLTCEPPLKYVSGRCVSADFP